jgi:hypothetical protein
MLKRGAPANASQQPHLEHHITYGRKGGHADKTANTSVNLIYSAIA